MKKALKYLSRYALVIAFLQAWVATLGSLYFSEIRHLVPCLLCWYQRILMYPLIIILAIAIVRKDKNIAYYVLPLTVIGMVISTYHYLLQWTQLSAALPLPCSVYSLCTDKQIIFFNFITIPFLSFSAFLLISIMMLILLKSKSK